MELREYLGVIRRRWWIVGLAATAAVVTAYLYANAQTPSYRSSVRLEATGRIDYSQFAAIDKMLRQLAARVKTSAVAEAVDERLKLGLGADALLARTSTQTIPDSLHIQIDVDDPDPGRAERLARAFAEVAQERQSAAVAPLPVQERVNVALLDRPSAPRLVWPQTLSIVLAGAVAGLLMGMVLAFVVDYLDDTLKTADDVYRSLGLWTLGALSSSALRSAVPMRPRPAPGAEPVSGPAVPIQENQ